MRNFFARIFAALRGAMSWLEDSWDWMSHTAVGRGCGYAWTAVKLPIAAVAATVGLALVTAKDLERMGPAIDAVGRAGAKVGHGVVGAVGFAAKAGAAAVSDVVGLSGALVRSVFGGNRGQGTPDQAAAQASARATSEQAKADDAADARVILAALRRVASSVAKGAKPEPSALEELPAGLAGYVVRLTADEADTLARARTNVLRALLDTGVAPDGVRSPRELNAELKASANVVVPNQVLQARIDAKRAADAEAELSAGRRVA